MQPIKTNFNALKLIIVIATIFIVWNNVETFTLNTGGILHTFSNYFCNPMIYVIIMAFGYLSCNNQFTWKDYKKLVLALVILSFISSVMYFDYFAFKEGYATVSYLVCVYFKGLFFDYGKWMLWIIIGLSAVFKFLTEKWKTNPQAWKIIQITIITITILLFLTTMIVGLYYFIVINNSWYNDFNQNLIYVSIREGGFLQLIPGIATFLIGICLNGLIKLFKKNSDILVMIAVPSFITILCLRIMCQLPVLYWDFTVIIQALALLIPFLVWKLPNLKFVNFLFYGTIMILMFHIAFNKLISVEFVLGILIRAIFGLSVARDAEAFVNNNMFIALIYSLTKLLILLIFCAWISKQYSKLFKFDFIKQIKNEEKQIVAEKPNQQIITNQEIIKDLL